MLYLFSNADCWHLLLLRHLHKTESLFVQEHKVGENGESSITQQAYIMSATKWPVSSMPAIAVRTKSLKVVLIINHHQEYSVFSY
jgi:hypothetical protein